MTGEILTREDQRIFEFRNFDANDLRGTTGDVALRQSVGLSRSMRHGRLAAK